MSQFIQKQTSGGGGGDPTIGNPVINGTPYSKLFIDRNGNLAENSLFYFNPDEIQELTAFSASGKYFIKSQSIITGADDIIIDISGASSLPTFLTVEIVSNSPDEFIYSEDGTVYGTPLPCGTPHTTPTGIVIDFGSSTGHNTGDIFVFLIMPENLNVARGILLRPKKSYEIISILSQKNIGSAIHSVEVDSDRNIFQTYENVFKKDTGENIEVVNRGEALIETAINQSTSNSSERTIQSDLMREVSTDALGSFVKEEKTAVLHEVLASDGASSNTKVSTDLTQHLVEITDGITTDSTRLFRSEFNIQAGQVVRVESNTGTVSLVKRDYVMLKPDVSTVNLPAWASVDLGKTFIIKNNGAAGNVTLAPNGADTIDGATSVTLSTNEAVTVIRTGTTGVWAVIGRA